MGASSFASARRAFWGIVDHALFSINNFSLNIILARWLAPDDYGAFAVAFSAFILISTLQIGTIIEPMLIFGAGRYDHALKAYTRTVSRLHFLVTALCALVLLGIAIVLGTFGSKGVASSFVGLAAATPFVLFVAVRRRVFYIDGRIHLAALTSSVLLIFSLAALYGLYAGGALSAFTGFLAIGAAGIAASLVSVVIPSAGAQSKPLRPPGLKEVFIEHWRYARWATPATAMSWVLINGFVIGLPLYTDVRAAAGLRAMLNLIQPPIQLLNALGTVALPSLVRADGSSRFRSIAQRSLYLFALAAIVYTIPVTIFSKPVLALLYHSRYNALSGLLLDLSPVPVFCAVITAAVIVLQSREQPRAVFISWLVGAATAVVVGVPMTAVFKLTGAAVSITMAYFTAAVTFSLMALHELRRPMDQIMRRGSAVRMRRRVDPIVALDMDVAGAS